MPPTACCSTAATAGPARTFDWTLLRDHPGLGQAIIAGGIGPHNAREARRLGAFAIDVGSALDARPGASRRRRSRRCSKRCVPPLASRLAAMRLTGRFGRFGGCYVPEILVPALEQLEAAFLDSQDDPAFAAELNDLLANYAGQADASDPLPQPAREYLSQTRGPASRRRAQDQSGAGPGPAREAHGQDPADRRDRSGSAWCRDGDGRRSARFRDHHLHGRGRRRAAGAQRLPDGADGRGGGAGDKRRPDLKDAINEALRDWSASFATTHYLLGTAAGPHPYPTMVREFQRVIGREARSQMHRAARPLARCGRRLRRRRLQRDRPVRRFHRRRRCG